MDVATAMSTTLVLERLTPVATERAAAMSTAPVPSPLPPPTGPAADVAPPVPYAAPAWEDVVRDHGDRVFRLAYRLTGNRHEAEDLTQEVFVRVFRSLSQYTPGTFEGWLHRITTNLFLDGVRRKARIRFDALPDDAGDRLAGREPNPAQVYDDASYDADVQAALDQLPSEFRAAVVLCDVEGLTYEEIADVLGVKLGTVRSRIHRGRAQLRDALAHRAPRTGTATRLPTPSLAEEPR
jgi:RNA polymerase sigma-70 factor (ECF subfamily)